MKLFASVRSFVSTVFRRSRLDSDMDEELRFHIQQRADDLERSGLSRAEAERRARMDFGGYQKYKEEIRESLGAYFLETLLQDIRYAARMLRKSPGFTAVAVLTLALGIGANTAIFSVTYDILLKPLPYPDSSRIVQLWETTAHPPLISRIVFISPRDFREIASQCRAFEQLAEYVEGGSTITRLGGAESVQTSYVSGNFFSVLGAQPFLGRPILPADAEPGHDQVAVLSYDLWQERYGGDPSIVGKQITLTDQGEEGNSHDHPARLQPYTIIGVMPSRFPFPNHGDLLLPQASWDRQSQLIAIGRLKPGVSIAAANAELHTIATRIATETPSGHKNFDLSVGLLRDRMSEGYITELLILLGTVAFVLLLACLNTSSLLVARSWVRQKEVAIRETLGATRWRLIRQFLSESVLLALLGAALGLLFAYWGIDLLRSMAPPSTPRLDEINIDRVVLAYTLGISILAGILFGFAPAMQLTRRHGEALKKGSPNSLARLSPHRPQRLKSLLVIGEISLAFVLVVGSTLVLRSFSNLMSVKLGFRPTHILTMYVNFSPATRANPERFKLAMDEVLQRTRALPGIENTAFGEWLPVGGTSFEGSVQVDGKGDSGPVEFQIASPGYFATLGIPLLAGRSFNKGDTNGFTPFPGQPNTSPPAPSGSSEPESLFSSAVHPTKGTQEGSPRVAIVNETLAKRYFEGNPLGKQFRTSDPGGNPIQVQIVGEVGDTRDVSPSVLPIPEYYIPFAQVGVSSETTLFVRTAANPMAMANAVREQVWMVDKDAPTADVMTMNAVMSERVAEPRFQTALLSAFGGLGLLLTIVGVYGLISYAMVQRTHEIGVRMALGAHPRHILRMMIREGMALAGVGIAVGIGGALAFMRFLQSLLFEIKPTDPATFAGVALLLALVALAACWIPARRAMRIDPMVALRYE